MTHDIDPALRDRLRQELEDERALQLEGLAVHGADPYGDSVRDLGVGNDGFADSAQASEERNEVLAQIETARHRLSQLDEALAQMDAGTYGDCSSCGQAIPSARLEARPLSVLCVSCAETAAAG